MKMIYLVSFVFLFMLTACATERANHLEVGTHEKYVDGKLFVVNGIGRVVPVKAVYSLDYIASQVSSRSSINQDEPSPIILPKMDELQGDSIIFPAKNQLEEMISLYEEGDLVMYYSLVDSGWALWKKGRIVKCWDVVHSM